MNHTKTAVFFLSTGRCGTQWLTWALQEAYPDVAHVRHEPVVLAYQPKRFLRAYDRISELASLPLIADHLNFIGETLRDKIYIETGWPCYALLPMMKEVLDARVKIVQLIRHPVPTALSLATHSVYARDGWIKDFAIDPFDAGVVQRDLRQVWHQLTMYEKCLFWWTEINMFGEELFHRYNDQDFFILRYEDLFDSSSNALVDLMAFMGLPYVETLSELRAANTDNWVYKTAAVDVSCIRRYAATVNLAQRFGYDVDRLGLPDLRKRYFSNSNSADAGHDT